MITTVIKQRMIRGIGVGGTTSICLCSVLLSIVCMRCEAFTFGNVPARYHGHGTTGRSWYEEAKNSNQLAHNDRRRTATATATATATRASLSSYNNNNQNGIFQNENNNNINNNNNCDTNSNDFKRLSGLNKRLQTLEEVAPEYLVDFYEPRIRSFSIRPGLTDKVSVTSTCYAVLALLAGRSSGVYDSVIQWSGTSSSDNNTDATKAGMCKISFQNVLQATLESEWRPEDLFQVSILLYTLLKTRSDQSSSSSSSSTPLLFSTKESQTVLRECLEIVLNARPMRRAGIQQPFSDYIAHHCTNVYTLVQASLVDPLERPSLGMLTENITALEVEVSLALERTAEASFNELCRQLSYRVAKDTTSFDSIRLAYSLLSYTKAKKSLLTSVLPINPPPRPVNAKVVAAALDAFFEKQNTDDGLWEKGQPIYRSFRKQGRSVGNAFVFVVDTCASLLEEMPPEAFRPHLDKLEKTLEWVETHQQVETIRNNGNGNEGGGGTDDGEWTTRTIRGWSSNHLSSEAGPLGWSTAQTLRFVSNLRQTIRQILHNDVLAEFNGISHSSKGPRPEGWDMLLDSDLGMAGGGACSTIKDVLDCRMCIPFEKGINNPSMGAAYSSILFGPPGTAKTTICESIAKRMGWDFVVIDTAVFLADGLSNVSARIRYVFERLEALHECVILFDEIEEFCLDRETPGISMESRMLTTAMLTAINDLRRKEGSVFFMATNRLRAFDSAITRPGRFDMQLFVGTPNLASRVVLLRQALEAVVVSEELKEETVQIYTQFLEEKWSLDGDAMFLNFLEGKQSAAAVAKIVSSRGRAPLVPELEQNLMQQATVMTVRGSVRDEFIASMDLSRF